MTWDWTTWRRGSYWILCTDWDYSDGRHEPGSVMGGKCWRCGAMMGIALPVDLFTGPLLMKAFSDHHRRCKPSLKGNRWELVVTLRYRRAQLEKALITQLRRKDAENLSRIEELLSVPGVYEAAMEELQRPPPRFKARAEVSADLLQVIRWETDGGP